MLKVQEIRELIKLIDESSISEFKYETDDAEVFLKKATGEVHTSQPVAQVQETQEAQPTAPAPKQEAPKEQPQQEQTEEKPENSGDQIDFDYEITSPMVGTFYAAPSPEDGPYVQVGDQVEKNTVVCIVEAMKLFNEIEAEEQGEIVERLVDDGELVEYGQPLFRIKKA